MWRDFPPLTDLYVINLLSPPKNNDFIAPIIPYKVSINGDQIILN